ncbi:anti-sigma factor [Pannus brasiliensis CCIBt3594]|uniref:Regulator of SigK n=1 Tax=Pannus brasiliensis CCIBt3594 TaxID=1427578 RepID=A0AAW9QQ25_9CHRO
MQPSDSLDELLAGYVLGDLTSEEAVRVRELLENDPEIAEEVRRLQITLALLPLSLPPVPVPAGARDRLLEVQQREIAEKSRYTRPNYRFRPRIVLLVGAMTALLAGLLWENSRLDRALTASNSRLERLERENFRLASEEMSHYRETIDLLRQPDNRFLSLRGIEPVSNASGSLVLVPRKDTAVLVLQDVRPLPAGKVYRMWAFVNGRKVSCSQFTPNERGEVFLNLPLDRWGAATRVVVTIEPEREIPHPVGEMAIAGS